LPAIRERVARETYGDAFMDELHRDYEALRAAGVRCRKGCACSTFSSHPFVIEVAPLVPQRLRSYGRFATKVALVFNNLHNGLVRLADTRFLR